MLINSEQAQERISSGSNLINRLRSGQLGNSSNGRGKAMSLFIPAKAAPTNTKIETTTPVKKPMLELPTFAVPTAVTPEVLPAEDSPSIDNILSDADSKIRLETVAKDALATLHAAVTELKNNIQNIRADRLPDVAVKMSKVVSDIRQNKESKDERPVHLHFYTPERRNLDSYPEVSV